LVPSDIDFHIKRFENQLEILPKITLDAEDEIERKYLIEPVTELIEELENLKFAESLINNNNDNEYANIIKNFIENSKLRIIMKLKNIEQNNTFNLYEKSNTFEDWLIKTQMDKISEVLKSLKSGNLNLNELSYEIYKTEQDDITDSYSLYIFTFLLGAFIIVLIENIIRSLYRNTNKI